MKTKVLERMPSAFWLSIKKKGLEKFFCEEECYDAEVLIIRTKTQCDNKLMDLYPNLKFIIRAGTGYDNVDLEYANQKNIFVSNTPEANAIAATEQTIAFLFSLMKRVALQKENVLSEKWKQGLIYNWEFSDFKLFIVGYGRIGKKVASIASFLGAKIKICDPFLETKEYENVAFNDGIAWCNAVTFHCPLSIYTKHYFNTKTLKRLKQPIWLVNASRGAVVEELALSKGFEHHLFYGVALDVFEKEPWVPTSFAKKNNVILAPHTGAFTKKAKERMADETLKIWEDFAFQNKYPKKIVNYDKLKPPKYYH